jgi:hypothetical protein
MPTFPDLITVISKIGPTVAVAAAPIYIVLYGELEFRYPRNRPRGSRVTAGARQGS